MLTPVAPSTSNINDRLQCRRHLKAEEVMLLVPDIYDRPRKSASDLQLASICATTVDGFAEVRSSMFPSSVVPPRENSRRAQQGHTKCGKARYGLMWPRMAQNRNIARTYEIFLWLRLVGNGLPIVVH